GRFACAPGLLGVGLFARQIDQRDVGAFARVQERDGATDARIRSGYQRSLATQLAGCAIPLREIVRLRLELRFETGGALVLFGKGRFRRVRPARPALRRCPIGSEDVRWLVLGKISK